MHFPLQQRKQIRLQGCDYSRPGYYFVTICTENRVHFFGEIRNGIVGLSDIGSVAARYWQEIPLHYPNVSLDAWVVMPNHVHGLLYVGYDNNGVKTNVGTRHGASLPADQQPAHNAFGPLQPRSLAAIINMYKSSVKRWCNQHGYGHFAWQPLFYESVVRDHRSLNRIRHYILINPKKWPDDRQFRKHHLIDN